ncbi:MAG: Uma2 family endonuclease [Leptospiraceae bacterium]|nr:Uma2 family endonuclease [Leptospiraceae bacterium]
MSELTIPLESLKRFSREEYHKLRDLGLLARHTELIEGVLIEKMTISPKHRHVIHKLRVILENLLPPSYFIFQESPLSIGNSEPEPDLCILKGSLEDYKDTHPSTAEWVIEIAASSLSLDLSKRKIYAEAQIPFYWIVDLEGSRIYVFEEPKEGVYQKENIYHKEAEISIPLASQRTISFEWI